MDDSNLAPELRRTIERAWYASRGGQRTGQPPLERLERQERLARAQPRVTADDLRVLERGEEREAVYLREVRLFLAQTDRSVLIMGGNVGTGKTFALASAIADRGGLYLPVHQLARLWSGNWRDREEYERHANARLLAVDDIGAESLTDKPAVQAGLLDLIDRRQGSPWITLIACNLNQADLEARYQDPRLWDRLAAHATYVGKDNAPNLRNPRVD